LANRRVAGRKGHNVPADYRQVGFFFAGHSISTVPKTGLVVDGTHRRDGGVVPEREEYLLLQILVPAVILLLSC